ncbi:hypothetical protein CCAX7_23550 [Capsulimonas corticalis]|uniref:Uncharacterized protein n=1 Tax=Capsulimonas corticalis TaxID=2219043 RepID=A0A402CV79_9BACT|nr:hypothetical protein [Capsulimonas corticalis]BDI30304.1 hypothetical protein CCAX7_23550 [Capsulimonas corticalis]
MKWTVLPAVLGFSLLAGGAAMAAEDAAPKAALPLVIYAEAGADFPYIPSGYMGNTGAIKMDDACKDNPHAGKTCLKVTYTASDNWGGVVWQNPVNNWGDAQGGWNLTAAKRLTFWARGAKGGEVVTFLFGLIGKDKTSSDSGSGKLDKVTLTKEWKQYTIDLKGQDLKHIVTGFAWTLGADGAPVTFYLDDVKYS